MNISAPALVPDLAGLALLLATAPNTATAIPGSAPPQSLPTGAGTFHSFESTLADLLTVEEKRQKKPEENSKQQETQTVITGVAIPTPPPETLPFEFAMPFQPAVKIAAESGQSAPQSDLLSATSQVANVKKGKALPTQDLSADFAFHVFTPRPLEPQAAPRAADQPTLASVEPKAATVPDLMPTPELPHLAFTEKFTPKADSQAETALPVAHPLPTAKSPVQSLPQPLASSIAEPDRAPEQRQGNGDQQHSSREPLPQPQAKPNAAAASREDGGNEKLTFEPLAPIAAPVREASPAQSAPPAPAARPAEIPRMEPEPSRAQATASSQPVGTHSISMRVTDGGDTHVDLKVTEHAGELKVTVRTADPDLSGSLRENLGDLVHKMEQSGFRADSWHPTQSNAVDDNPQTRRSERESLGGDSQGRQHQQQAGDGQQRKQQDPERARWIEELETNFSPDSERKAPIWPPASVL